MDNSRFTAEYARLCEKLLQMRTAAALTQRALAERLGREYSFVWRIEKGERRLDLVEFAWVCRACGRDPVEEATELLEAFAAIEAAKARGRRGSRAGKKK